MAPITPAGFELKRLERWPLSLAMPGRSRAIQFGAKAERLLFGGARSFML
jgi:hypothetical protein